MDYVVDLFNYPGVIMSKLAGIGDMASEFVKKILRSVLPNPGGSGPASWAAKAIPDSIYEYAGINPKTGENVGPATPTVNAPAIVQPTSTTGTPTKALEKTTTENIAAKDEGASKMAAAASAATIISSGGGGGTVNNNTTQAAIIRAKSTNWEPDDQWARGASAFG